MKKNVIVSLLAVLFGLIAGALLMAATGSNPFVGYTYLFAGGLKSIERVGNTLATATPLIFTGLSVAFAFRTGLFNIGASGQMLFGGFCATFVGLTLDLPKAILVPIVILVGFVAGALWAFLPGLLKARFNVHEVVSTIMLNWTAYWIVYNAVPTYLKGSYETESRPLPVNAQLRMNWLSDLFGGSYINMGIFLGVLAVIAIAFIIDRTTLGYEMKAVGFNRHAAEFAGMAVGRNIVLAMVISGGLAGLAGVVQYMGNAINIQIGHLPNQGFDGIAVALLGANNPYGVMLAAIFFGLLYSGRGYMNAMVGIPPEISDTIIAIIIYFAATSILIERLISRIVRKRREKRDAEAESGRA